MNKKLKNLIDECLLFVNNMRPSKWRGVKKIEMHIMEMYRNRLAHAVIGLCSVDLERDADTGDLKLDVLEDEEPISNSIKIVDGTRDRRDAAALDAESEL